MQRRANVDRVRWVDGPAAFLNVLNLSFLVHHEGRAAGKLRFLVENSVGLRDLSFHVAEQRKLDPDFLGKGGIGWRSIDADAQHFRVIQIDFARLDTSLVSLEFFRSTACKRQHIESQNHVLFASKIAELHSRSLVASQGEVRRRVSHL